MPHPKPRVLVLINPGASQAETASASLSDWFAERCDARIVSDPDAFQETLRGNGDALDLVVIGGGDGTISKGLPDLLKLKKPFAVLPLGTANDFARTIGLPDDPLEAAEIALHGRQLQIDIGTVNGKPFINVASVGLATKVAKAQSAELKRRFNVFAYAIGLLRALRERQPFFIDLKLDEGPVWSGPVYQVSVANGRYHGGGLSVADDAAIDDGRLNLYLIYPGKFWQLVACIAHLKFGFAQPEALEHLSASSVSVRTSRKRSINADGELAAETPAEFGQLPKALTVMVPQQPR